MKRSNIVGMRVHKARTTAKPPVTQGQLSRLVSRSGVRLGRCAIAKIESGNRSVLDYELVALAHALGTSTRWLLGETPARPRARRGFCSAPLRRSP
jgi:HTH-type transcriptional regulator, cell division transcriptional repressor